MKNFKYLILLIFLYGASIKANNITFTPSTQNVTANSGEEIEVSIQLNCYGSQPGASSWFINPYTIPDGGYIIHSPGTGAMYLGDVTNVTFRFNRTVTTTTTTNYVFRQDWYDEMGNDHTGFLYINVTYVNNSDPDSDGDGVPDSEDDCPNEAGPASNNGCPEPDCNLPSPSNRTTSDITTNSAIINWNSVSGNDGYKYRYRKDSGGSWTYGNTSSTSKSISGLESNTEYIWRVQTKCDNGEFGNYSGASNFTTLEEVCNLPSPSNLETNNISYYKADINWDNIVDNDGYQIEYKLITESEWTPTNTAASVITQTINSLEYSSTYQWRIRTKCNNGLYSNWSEIVEFTTACFPYYIITEDVDFSGTDIKQASNYIIANNKIYHNAHAEYSAGESIRLIAESGILEPEPGITGPEQPNSFHAKSGSTFRAYIEDCSGNSSGRIKNNDTKKESITETYEYIEEKEVTKEKIEIIKLYPNPTNGRVTIKSTEDMLQWELFNSFGRTINKDELGSNSKKVQVNLNNSPTGLYFIKITLISGEQIIKRIIKK